MISERPIWTFTEPNRYQYLWGKIPNITDTDTYRSCWYYWYLRILADTTISIIGKYQNSEVLLSIDSINKISVGSVRIGIYNIPNRPVVSSIGRSLNLIAYIRVSVCNISFTFAKNTKQVFCVMYRRIRSMSA